MSDPQFWIVTGVFVIAAGWLLKGVLPRMGRRRRRGQAKRATLTVGGQRMEKRPRRRPAR
ncbi:MAG: hypothetical protein H7Y88_06715 [Phycisphaerales bacterium]|nr:hypothetical protein [Phycisphaerales bacterium]